jgi:hypothetical protein
MTPEQEERLRELYRKNFLALILLPPEAVADEYPELVRRSPVGRESRPPGVEGLQQDRTDGGGG